MSTRRRAISIWSATVFLALGSGAPAALGHGVHPRFDLRDPQGGPFPSDLFTVPDARQLTGLRVHLRKPDCLAQPSDCNDVDVLNDLDGFNLQPRLSIPFTGPIDPATVSSDTVFLVKLDCLVASCPSARRVGVDQVVWDPATDTLYARSEQLLDQDARYVLVVTDGVRDTAGNRIGHMKDRGPKALRTSLSHALRGLGYAGGHVATASVFTTQSATAVLEKIRRQLTAATPWPAEFTLGRTGERTVFALGDVTGIAWKRQETTGDAMTPPRFTSFTVPLDRLRVVPGAIGRIAFGRFRSPDYETAEGRFPAIATRTGVPRVQRTNELYFNLFLPAGPEPAGGWPVVIAGHGAGNGKNIANVPFGVAAKLAQHGLAAITINAVAHGGGPDGTLTVTRTDGTTVTLPDGGRNIDRNGDGTFSQPAGSLPEGVEPGDPKDAITLIRDAVRQTLIDEMQLAREIRVGIDVDGDGAPDLDRHHISYFGNSLGGIIGIPFAALEPSVRASVLGEPGGSIVDAGRLNSAGPFRGFLGQILAGSTPSLLNLAPGMPDPINPAGNPFPFDENIPARDQPPMVNTVLGAIAIQDKLDRIDWAQQSGDPIAYAAHLRKAPLTGTPTRPVLIAFAQGDQVVATTTAGNLLRAGDLEDRTIYFRALDAFGNPNPAQVHEWLVQINPNLTQPCFALRAQESTATFLASDGATVLDPDTVTDPPCPGPFFETPITGLCHDHEHDRVLAHRSAHPARGERPARHRPTSAAADARPRDAVGQRRNPPAATARDRLQPIAAAIQPGQHSAFPARDSGRAPVSLAQDSPPPQTTS